MSKLTSVFRTAVEFFRAPEYADRRQRLFRVGTVAQNLLDRTRAMDFLAPLLLRAYLAPIFWMAGTRKFAQFQATADWFGNADTGLGFPLPYLMVFLAASTEVLGAILLVLGLAVRWISLPLMVTMVVAALSVHWKFGWLAVASGSGLFATERTIGAIERLERAKEVLQGGGDYEWLTEFGNFVVLNNGIEFAATYFAMLLVLFFVGGGKYVSIDYWIRRRCLDARASSPE